MVYTDISQTNKILTFSKEKNKDFIQINLRVIKIIKCLRTAHKHYIELEHNFRRDYSI